jgi:hypothetical protein
MCFDGIGVDQDFKEAAKWLRLAAPKGVADAQYRLGILYKEGLGVDQNFSEAEKWLRLAAGRGIEKAQTELGALLLKKAILDKANSAAAQ